MRDRQPNTRPAVPRPRRASALAHSPILPLSHSPIPAPTPPSFTPPRTKAHHHRAPACREPVEPVAKRTHSAPRTQHSGLSTQHSSRPRAPRRTIDANSAERTHGSFCLTRQNTPKRAKPFQRAPTTQIDRTKPLAILAVTLTTAIPPPPLAAANFPGANQTHQTPLPPQNPSIPRAVTQNKPTDPNPLKPPPAHTATMSPLPAAILRLSFPKDGPGSRARRCGTSFTSRGPYRFARNLYGKGNAMLRQLSLIAAVALLAGCQSTGVWGSHSYREGVTGDEAYASGKPSDVQGDTTYNRGVSGDKNFSTDAKAGEGARGGRVVRSDSDFNTESARPAGFDNSTAPRYPTDLRASDDLRATAVVDRAAGRIKIVNPSDQSLRDVKIWVDGRYAGSAAEIPARGTMSVDRSGLDVKSTSRIQIQSGDKLYNVQGPAFDSVK